MSGIRRKSLPGRLSWQGCPLPCPHVGQGELLSRRCFGLRVLMIPPPSGEPVVPLYAIGKTLPKQESWASQRWPQYAVNMTTSVPSLTSVSLYPGNGSFIVKYELSGPVPQSDTFLIGIHGVSQDGQTIRQLGIKFLDGDCIANFVFDHNAARQANLEYVPIGDDPRVIQTTYPSAPFDALGTSPKLRGYLTYASEDRQTDIQIHVIN